MVVDGTSTTGEEFPCRIHPAAGSDWDSLRGLGAKIPCFGGAARRLPLPRLSGFGSVSSFQPLRTSQCGAAPEHVGLNQHGRGGAAAHLVSVVFRQRQCCLLNRCELVSTRRLLSFGSADLTLLAGDFVPGFQDYPESAGP